MTIDTTTRRPGGLADRCGPSRAMTVRGSGFNVLGRLSSEFRITTPLARPERVLVFRLPHSTSHVRYEWSLIEASFIARMETF